MSIGYLDQEILSEILKRLPVKLLLQFRCVSKSWYSLISSPTFISIHTQYTLEHNRCCTEQQLLRHYSWTQKKEMYTTIQFSEHQSSAVFQELAFTFSSYSQYFEIVGSCNGVLCLSDTYRVSSHSIILWNPTIRKSVTLPTPHFNLGGTYLFVLGFGFDCKSHDYKVVRIVYSIGDHGFKVVIAPEVEVYELSKGTWRSISVNTAPKHVISELSLQVFLNGAIHWIGYNPTEAGGDFCDLSLVLFDVGEDKFREMKLPDSVAGLSVLDLSVIVVSGNLLSLIQYNRHTRSPWIQYGGCHIWVMKEYGVVESWTRQFNIDLEGGVRKALGLQRNGEVLLVSSSGELISYDPENEGISHLGIKGIAHSFYLDIYMETLVLLQGQHRILGKASPCDAIIDEEEPQEDRLN